MYIYHIVPDSVIFSNVCPIVGILTLQNNFLFISGEIWIIKLAVAVSHSPAVLKIISEHSFSEED